MVCESLKCITGCHWHVWSAKIHCGCVAYACVNGLYYCRWLNLTRRQTFGTRLFISGDFSFGFVLGNSRSTEAVRMVSDPILQVIELPTIAYEKILFPFFLRSLHVAARKPAQLRSTSAASFCHFDQWVYHTQTMNSTHPALSILGIALSRCQTRMYDPVRKCFA